MKNILSAVLLLCFFGMGTTVLGQGHLSVIERNLPCNIYSGNYKLYIQAANPSVACNQNFINITGGNATGHNGGKAIYWADSPTNWAYRIDVMGSNGSSNIVIEETVFKPNCANPYFINKRTIKPKNRLAPVAIIDLEIIDSDLCSGEFEVRAHHASMTHHEYDWYINNVYMNTTTTATSAFNLGNNINTSFTLTVAASNGCTSTSYSENFIVKEPKTMMQPSINLPVQYCDGTKNEFTVNNPTLGIEYKWDFLPDSPSSQTKQGLDMTSFSPNFGTTNVSGIGATNNYTIELFFKTNCATGWVSAQKIIVDPVVYSSNCSGSGSKVAEQRTSIESVKEYSVEGGATNITAKTNSENKTSSSKFSAVDGQGQFSTAYPNPTTGKVELKNSAEAIQNIFVYDVTGTLVAQQLEVNSNNTAIDLGDLSNGMYLITIQAKTSSESVKVIKQ